MPERRAMRTSSKTPQQSQTEGEKGKKNRRDVKKGYLKDEVIH